MCPQPGKTTKLIIIGLTFLSSSKVNIPSAKGERNMNDTLPPTSQSETGARDLAGTPASTSESKTWQWFHTLGIVLILLAITLVGWFSPPAFRLEAWLISLVLIAVFIIIAGHGTTGLWRGWLIDDRYMMSLSRLQAVLWTVVILSAFFIAALGNLKLGDPNPLEVAIPVEIWLVMGISVTSLVGSPLIRSNKKKQDPDPKEGGRTITELTKERGARTIASRDTLDLIGLVIVNLRPEDASLSDLFRGEETGNGALLDLGKIQLFLFTLLIVLVYVSTLSVLFNAGTAIHSFEPLDESTIALLGISHAAYLTNKAIPHSKTA
jgi:hypothetical protein